MAWITLTSDDVKRRLTKPEVDRIPSVARNIGQTAESLLDAATSEVSREIRGHVAVKNILGPTGTIPEELENAALALIRRVVFGRVPGTEDLFGKVRQDEAADAQKLLFRVSEGKFAIVPPGSPADDQAGNFSSTIIHSRPDIVGNGKVDGL